MTAKSSVKSCGHGQYALVADIGGTNTRFALTTGEAIDSSSVQRFENTRIGDLNAAIEDYLRACNSPAPQEACIAVAGPVAQNRAELTNRDWEIVGQDVSDRLGGIPVYLINDLQAVGYGLHRLRKDDLMTLFQGSHGAGNRQLAINAGTGFNAVVVHHVDGHYLAAPSECGHTSLPHGSREIEILRQHIESRNGFASVEDILSGRGAKMVGNWARQTCGTADKTASETYHRILAETLGAITRDLTLTHLPFGGVFLTGGVGRGIASQLNHSGFVESFLSAGRFSEFMRQFSIHLICDDQVALKGCAVCLGQQIPAGGDISDRD